MVPLEGCSFSVLGIMLLEWCSRSALGGVFLEATHLQWVHLPLHICIYTKHCHLS